MRQSAIGNKGFLGRKHTDETKTKMSKPRPNRQGMPPWNKGMKFGPLSLELRIKAGEKNRGSNNPNWKGGLSPIRTKIRQSLEYRFWKEGVYKKCDNSCVDCGIKGDINSSYLNADHIKPFALFPELRLDIDNGRVLCLNCHSKTDTYKGRTKPKLLE